VGKRFEESAASRRSWPPRSGSRSSTSSR
jgi:hypothetical protein